MSHGQLMTAANLCRVAVTEQTFLHKILVLQAVFLSIKYNILLQNHKYYEQHIQVFDIQAEIMFILIKCLCTSCGYVLLVTRCRGHELHVCVRTHVVNHRDFRDLREFRPSVRPSLKTHFSTL